MNEWKVHTYLLLKEIVNCSGQAILEKPINIFGKLLAAVGERAVELNDPKLNALMCRLTIYTVADPESPDYDPATVREVMKSANDPACGGGRDAMAGFSAPICSAAGFPIRRHHKWTKTPSLIAKALDAYFAKRMTPAEIETNLRVSHGILHKYAKRDQRYKPAVRTRNILREIIRLYKTGMPIMAIGEQFGIDATSVHRALRKAKVKSNRKPGPRPQNVTLQK